MCAGRVKFLSGTQLEKAQHLRLHFQLPGGLISVSYAYILIHKSRKKVIQKEILFSANLLLNVEHGSEV